MKSCGKDLYEFSSMAYYLAHTTLCFIQAWSRIALEGSRLNQILIVLCTGLDGSNVQNGTS